MVCCIVRLVMPEHQLMSLGKCTEIIASMKLGENMREKWRRVISFPSFFDAPCGARF